MVLNLTVPPPTNSSNRKAESDFEVKYGWLEGNSTEEGEGEAKEMVERKYNSTESDATS